MNALGRLGLTCALLAAAGAFSLAVLTAEPARGQSANCLPVERMHRGLTDEFGESIAGMGIAAGVPFRLYLSPGGATWSIVAIHRAYGVACMVAAGKSWVPGEIAPAARLPPEKES